jgi:hypothetical protein
MLCHSGNTFKLAITKIIVLSLKKFLGKMEESMVISDLDYLENSEGLTLMGGILDIGGGESTTNNSNTASFNTIITSALGILAPATSLNNILVTQVNGSADAGVF